MKISKLVTHTNRVVGRGSYSFDQLSGYFDEAIDNINADLSIFLPLMSEVYAYTDGTAFELTEAELLLTYVNDSLDNEYLRIPAAYLRNYVAYEAAYRVLRDEDEDNEVLYPKMAYAKDWYRKLIGAFNDYTMEDTESISIGGDADELDAIDSLDDTGVGFYNPIDPIENQ